MNPSRTAVVCDSGCDIGRRCAAAFGITIIDLIVNYKSRSVKDLDLLQDLRAQYSRCGHSLRRAAGTRLPELHYRVHFQRYEQHL